MSFAKRSRPRVGFVFHCPLISGHRVDKINIPALATGVHSWLIVFLDSLLLQRMTERGPYPHLGYPRPLTFVTLAEKRGSILGFHSWFSRLQPLMIGQRSCHSGLDFTIKSSFQVRFHFLIAFSRMIADSMDECCSNHTSK